MHTNGSPAAEVIKTCTCCGAQLTAPQWEALKFLGNIETETEDERSALLELRNCACGSTIAIETAVDHARAA